MSKINAWLHASRLRTLPLAFSSIITGSVLAYKQFPQNFSITVLVLSLVTTLLLQVLSNLANDYGDSQKGTDNDDRIGPKRAIQAGLLSFTEMKAGIVITTSLALVSGIWLIIEATKGLNIGIGIFFFLLGIAAIAAAIKYTVGKNAYGYLGFGDMFVIIFFGWVGVVGSYFLQAKSYAGIILLPATTIGFLAATVLHLNNMRDSENDALAGKNTIAVSLGLEKSKLYFYWLILIAFFCWSILFLRMKYEWWQFAIAALPFLLFAYSAIKVFRTQEAKDFDSLLKVNAVGTFLLSLLLSAILL
ncbi:MAG: 1,4-dihydroxy-2-naphthoate octaprenyltransferase [Chitinophagales bacterium]|nr:1,4-dihydroxy-2-naphthoate octaprenyltransferase [Chitinophagales bacterium]MCO5281300.1 1,4-dihydroxy-2-naphthoate octaprenyltransferase [Chitinophagales bacterium]HRP39097.1 1,4-dihydroxy-2-naphthoate octaprenyltransferase [Chitinophagales bacterium]